MKNIAICCDGTWNRPEEKCNGVPVPTNVVKLYNALAMQDPAGHPQHLYYHPGIGSADLWDRAVGTTLGNSLNDNIMSAYRELCDFHEPGDRIFLFGFSRGAYTVRCLAELVHHAGLLDLEGLDDEERWYRIRQVFRTGYRFRSETRACWDSLGWKFRNDTYAGVPVHFIGVWDTVGPLGIPQELVMLNQLDNLHDYSFHNTMPCPAIRVARHAVALDEMRAGFQPTLWDDNGQTDLLQMWFPGVHADVGGGYLQTGLSDIALDWMIGEAEQQGLAFRQEIREQIRPDCQDVMHDSCTGMYALLPSQPRATPELAHPTIHLSARKRHTSPPISQAPYRPTHSLPANLDIFATNPWNHTGIWLEAGRHYFFRANGQWMGGNIRCGPAGTHEGHFHLAEIAQLAAATLERLEARVKKLVGNKTPHFLLTRRHDNLPWFCLVGAIANGGGVNAKGHLDPHETFLIGEGCEYTPRRSGYFYAYANDTSNHYGNNKGRIRLNIA